MSRYTVVLAVCLALLAGGFYPSRGATSYEEAVEQFFTQLKDNKVDEALDQLYSSNPWMGRRKDNVTNLKTQLKQVTAVTGEYREHQLLTRQELGGRLVYLSYFVAYERQPFRFEFQFYKPADTWVTYSFHIDENLADELTTHGRAEALRLNTPSGADQRLALGR
jgi:hypothetical protein